MPVAEMWGWHLGDRLGLGAELGSIMEGLLHLGGMVALKAKYEHNSWVRGALPRAWPVPEEPQFLQGHGARGE